MNRRVWLAVSSWLAFLAAGPASASPETRSYALIVANNRSTDPGTAPLRFADDDGARFAELFSLLGGRVELLSVLDETTQRLHPKVAALARAPTRAELRALLGSIFADIERDETRGLTTVFYFVYVGHGSIGDEGEGAMHLLDGRFSRSDLFQQVVAPSPARFNHLIIDACNAYLMVAHRGEDSGSAPSVDRAALSFLAKEGLARHPNTGVLASTAKAADVHEWDRFEAGVFSHEVRSAFAGAADVDRDGRISYDEVRAFISAANARVQDSRARIEVHAAAPPLHLLQPIFDRGLARDSTLLRIPARLSGRRYLEDERGVRFADFNIADDGPITLALVPSAQYFLRSDDLEIPIALGSSSGQEIDAGTLKASPSQIRSRGSEALTFQRDLFAIPYGRAYFEGYRASWRPAELPGLTARSEEAGDSSPILRFSALGLAAAGLAAIATGIGFGLAANDRAEEYRGAIGPPDVVDAIRQESETSQLTANALYAAGSGLFASSALLWLLSNLAPEATQIE